MSDNFGDTINSHIWREEAEATNPYAASRAFCRGYDVYGDLLGKASYIEYLYLLIRGERPTRAAAQAFELLAVALANPGPRDPSVHAAAAAGATGNPASSALMAALAAGAGSHGGARETLLAMQLWLDCGLDLARWSDVLGGPARVTGPLFWPQGEAAPGFDPHGSDCALPVRQTLERLQQALPDGALGFLQRHRGALEQAAGKPLAMAGVAAAAWFDLGFNPVQAEMTTLLLRLPGAATHALEQAERGFRQFPFFELDLQNDPANQFKEAA